MPHLRGGARPNSGPLPSLFKAINLLVHTLDRHVAYAEKRGDMAQLKRLSALRLALESSDDLKIDTVSEFTLPIE